MTDVAPPDSAAPVPHPSAEPILQVRDLRVTFSTADGRAPAVRGVDLDVRPGEALAVVGESGSGKSVTMLALLGLLRSAEVTGSARYRGTELVGLDAATMRTIRGNKVSMIFQDPMASLNPVLTIGRQMTMVMRAHQTGLGKRAPRASNCSTRSRSRRPAGGSTTTRTSSRAACASGS
jgi:ABC-type microcin C transport system duplicated ATPase subunit YejF